jgi:hypothetical protein
MLISEVVYILVTYVKATKQVSVTAGPFAGTRSPSLTSIISESFMRNGR